MEEEPCQVGAAEDGRGEGKLSEAAAFVGMDSSVVAAIVDEGRVEVIALGWGAAGPAGEVTVTFAAVGSWDCSAVQVKSHLGAASVAEAVAGGLLAASLQEMMKPVHRLVLAASVDRLYQALAVQHSAAAFATFVDAAVFAARLQQPAAVQCCLGSPAAVQSSLEKPAAGSCCLEKPAAGSSCLENPAAGLSCLGNLVAVLSCLGNLAAELSCLGNPAAGPNCLGNPAAVADCQGKLAAVQS